MSLSSDVYAFAMTILEVCCPNDYVVKCPSLIICDGFQLMTHKKPYADYKNPIAIPAYASAGERPARPSEPRVIERGLDNALWSLICNGWATEVSQRPSIQEMLTSLSAPL
jgi:hypothetical protein